MSVPRKVKVVQLAIGVDLLGSKMSMAASPNIDLTLLEYGVSFYSKATNRTIIIPFSNIKGIELLPEEGTVALGKSPVKHSRAAVRSA